VLGGTHTTNPPFMVRPSDDYLVLLDQGEADANAGTSAADWFAQAQQLLSKVYSDFGPSNRLGTIVGGLSPLVKNAATQAMWDQIRSGQDMFNAFNSSVPPAGNVPHLESDCRSDDPVHYSAPGHWEWSGRALTEVLGWGMDLGIAA